MTRARIAAVAYPVLTDADRTSIESIRALHDPQVRLIAGHFTLVFPAELEPEPLLAHTRRVCESSGPIRFVIRKTLAVRETSGVGGHVFLVPDDGHGEIVALHQRLYDGGTGGTLHAGQPFVPHITVAADRDFARCLELEGKWNLEAMAIEGLLDRVDVVAVSSDRVQSLATYRLGTPLDER
jgi:2'-5' RNA ligase